ncbi:type II toxin-antitoxin system RelE/ParE family toxin [Candidatus Thiodubiliella endoseptemdiera]|uniref:type II toxin-antitoxin system RelE family toxin n=1 Tax=Candidatus Thiodubiliella endoseptemdiera TaxID=2738886 RepID=UPI0034DFABC4
MSYKLEFLPKALSEWKKLNTSIKEPLKKKLEKRLANPKAPKDKLKGYEDVYKIKLQSSGYRLAYQVIDERVAILVVAVGKREDKKIYKLLQQRY